MKKTKRKKLPNIQTLKKKAWRLFSEYIRKRDNYTCISCSRQCEKGKGVAGHFVPKSYGLSLYFDPKNVNFQCVPCNLFRHGNLSSYAVALRKNYGPNILEELDAKRKEVKKYTRSEYMDLIEKYKV